MKIRFSEVDKIELNIYLNLGYPIIIED